MKLPNAPSVHCQEGDPRRVEMRRTIANIKETSSTANAAGTRDVVATTVISLSSDILDEVPLNNKFVVKDEGRTMDPYPAHKHETFIFLSDTRI